MVVALKPGRFYGSSLPRPRILPNVPDDQRCEPPGPVNGSLLRWASHASWKMGGLSSTVKRFQGKIEGRLSKLRAMEEDSVPEENGEPPAKSSRSSNLKSRGRFGGTSSKRSSRWKPHRKRLSRKKSPLRLTVGKDIMRKHEEQTTQSDVQTKEKSPSSLAKASSKRPSKKRPAPRRPEAKRSSVKRELLVDEGKRSGSSDEEEDDEDEEDDEEEEGESDAEMEAFQAKLETGQLPLRRSARLRSSPSGGGDRRSQQSDGSDTDSASESEAESGSEGDC